MHMEKEKRSHVWIFHSVHPFNACFPLLVISHSSRERSSLIPEKKKKSSQSYCQFASLLLRLLGSSDLRLQRFNYYFFFVSVHKTRPLNTEQSLPIAIVDNTVYNNESDGDN